jgi:hypothetical protein
LFDDTLHHHRKGCGETREAAFLGTLALEMNLAEILYDAHAAGMSGTPREVYKLQQELGEVYDKLGISFIKYDPKDAASAEQAHAELGAYANGASVGQLSARRYVAYLSDELKAHFTMGR